MSQPGQSSGSETTSQAWNRGVDEAQGTINKVLDTTSKYDVTGASQVGRAVSDLSAAGARSQGERAKSFENKTGMSVQDQVEQGVGPASESLAGSQP